MSTARVSKQFARERGWIIDERSQRREWTDGRGVRYRSQEELIFARLGWREFVALIIQPRFATTVPEPFASPPLYEPIAIRLPGGTKYTPDFVFPAQRLVCLEIKGSRRQRGYQVTRVKLRETAALWPQWEFWEGRYGNNQWEFEKISKS